MLKLAPGVAKVEPGGQDVGNATSGDDVVAFWLAAGPEKWFRGGELFDHECRTRFEAAWQKAAAGELAGWEATATGALGLLLLLDQMPRNMFRGTPKAYASDAQALAVADRAIARGFQTAVDPSLRRFFHLPFSHSETLADQERAVRLSEEAGDADAAKWARHHRDVVARFGRFPHRNAILGRPSTPEEEAWMAEEGAFKG